MTLKELLEEQAFYPNKDGKFVTEIKLETLNILIDKVSELQNNWDELKNILQNIEEIIEGSLTNVGRNEDCFEYYLGDVDCERILEMIPEFEELEGVDGNIN